MKTDINGNTLVIDKPVTSKKAQAAHIKALAERDARIAKEEAAAKAKAKASKASHAKSKAALQSKADKAAEKAKATAEREAKRADKAKKEAAAKKGDKLSDARSLVMKHNEADTDAADKAAVTMAVSARQYLMTHVIGTKVKDAHLMVRVSGRGVTMVPFKHGTTVLALARGLEPDENGKFPQREFDVIRKDYNNTNSLFNDWMAKVENEKTRKFTVKASPTVKKGNRTVTAIKATRFNLAALQARKDMKATTALTWFNALLEVSDTSERLLNLGAARLVNDPAAFTRADEGKARGKFGRHLSHMRHNKRLGRPAYASKATLAEINKAGDDSLKASEIFPLILADAKAYMLANAKAPAKQADPIG